MPTNHGASLRLRAEGRRLRTFSRLHVLTSAVCAPLLVLLSAAPAFAQGTTVVQPQSIPYVELFVTLALCGAAVFAVCRSSRRN